MKILSHEEFCRDYSKFKHAIIIRDPNQTIPEFECSHLDSYLCLHFHDIYKEDQMRNGVVPKRHHIDLAIYYAKVVGIEDLAVTCWAGISRSSAIAFTIMYSLYRSISAAHRILDKSRHRPNFAIMNIVREMCDAESTK